MRKKVTVTITGGLTLAQALVEGVSMNIKPIDDMTWKGSKIIDLSDPLIEVVSIVRGPYLTKATVKTKINGIEKPFNTYSKSSARFSYDNRDYPKSDFNL